MRLVLVSTDNLEASFVALDDIRSILVWVDESIPHTRKDHADG